MRITTCGRKKKRDEHPRSFRYASRRPCRGGPGAARRLPRNQAIARLISLSIYLYPIGLALALGFAWAGRKSAFLLAFGAAVATTAAVLLYPRLADMGTHGSPANMTAWRMAVAAYFMLGGLFLAGLLSVVLAAWGAQRREARLDQTEPREADGR